MSPPGPESVFLVSAGARGVTAHCVRALASRYRSRFILVGRTEYPVAELPGLTDAGVDDSALKQRVVAWLRERGEKPLPKVVQRECDAIRARAEIAATLDAVAAAGGHAEYVCADVTDADALRTGLAGPVERLGQVTGVIHGAGVLADKVLERKTGADFDAVYRPKIHGLRALLDSVDADALQHLVLFSSAAGFYGNVGQADYAMANEVLNKIAHGFRREHPGCRVVTVGWGPWAGGMVTDELAERFRSRGIDVIPVDDGANLLTDLLAAPTAPVQVLVGSPMKPDVTAATAPRAHRMARRLTLAVNPFLRDHTVGVHPVLPVTCAMGWLADASEQRYPGYRFFAADAFQVLKGIVFDTSQAEDYQLDLTELGRSDDDGEVRLNAQIASTTAGGRPRYHYRARLTLRRDPPAAPRYTEMNLGERAWLDGAELYRDGTLFHGPRFRGVERVVNMDFQRLTLRCSLPAFPEWEQGQFRAGTFNPFVADSLLQGIVIWARHVLGMASLPLGVVRGEQYRPLRFGQSYYVSIEPEVQGDSVVVADVTAHDESGEVYLRLTGAEVHLSGRLNDLFAQGAALMAG